MQENLVIVESPAKAKKIEEFLGKDYKVMSSYGHIRDLKKKELSINEKTMEPDYEIPEEKKKLVTELKTNAKKAKKIWLASDEDREGEAISWHLCEVLGLDEEKTNRIVFHEITKQAILDAIKNPRHLDMNLVNAQQARRVLDRLVGFKLSPILWRKVKPALSAGRVQSVAVRLIVEREREIQKFQSVPYYRVTAIFALISDSGNATEVKAELDQRFNPHEEVEAFLEKCKDAKFMVESVTKKPLKRSPAPPFTTSTLQQEAARKLGFTVVQTMMIAQKLYESGRITYMRTDSVNLSTLCSNASKDEIIREYGKEYSQTRDYHTSSKGAQEAHEAIRPTYMNEPTIEGTAQEKRLYELIWKRTIASQMADAQLEKTTININIGNTSEKFVATGEVVSFDGFLKVYLESTDDEEHAEDSSHILPALKEGDELQRREILATEKYSLAPARYTEASLVKKLEDLGIGRPSTYAPTISTIQQRQYVVKGDKTGEELANFDYLYLSGISLAILSPTSREKLLSLLRECRANGGKVIFDNNYRPRLWASKEETQQVYQQMLECTDIAFLTLDDEDALWGQQPVEDVIARTHNAGVKEVVVKRGADSCLVSIAGEGLVDVPAVKLPKEKVIDTTAAGDSFSAGYLAVRLTGGSAEDAAKRGHLTASTVIQYRGAIIPREAMPA